MATEEFLKDFKAITKRKNIGYFLKKYKLNNIICEIGVRSGENLFRLVKAAQPQIIYGIDSWKDDGIFAHNDVLFTQAFQDELYDKMKNVELKDPRIKIIRDYSVNASKLFPNEFFDFIHIDADHSYEGVKEDIETWWPKLKTDGIMSGHDYINHNHFGVIKAVDEFKIKNNIQHFHLTKEKWASWFFVKSSQNEIGL